MYTTTKHIYIEGERVCSKIGSGFKYANVDPTGDPIDAINGETGDIASDLWEMVLRGISCTEYNTENVSVYPSTRAFATRAIKTYPPRSAKVT